MTFVSPEELFKGFFGGGFPGGTFFSPTPPLLYAGIQCNVPDNLWDEQ